MEVREARVDGRLVRWRVDGAGPPLVLVHGLGGSWRWWRDALPALAARHECHLLDVPRFGPALRPDDAGRWLGDWADAAGLERASVVGHSLGGLSAAVLAAQRPELVERLVLIAAAGMPSRRGLAAYALPLAGAVRATGPMFLLRLSLDALRTGPLPLLRGGLYAARADVRDQARSIDAPTLLVWGDRDPLVPPELAEGWRRELPRSRLVLLQGTGHVPMVERPSELAEALLAFLDEPGDVGRGRPVRRVRDTRQDDEPPAR